MEGFFIFIKHHFSIIWRIIEWGNGFLFSCLYKSSLEQILSNIFQECSKPPFSYRKIDISDCEKLYNMINEQELSDFEYFHPHGFDLPSIRKQFSNRSFLMMGAFEEGTMVGYFFLRFFANRKCFVGRLIHKEFRGKGIGKVMNAIMYEIAWRMGFRCLSTISRKNSAVMRAHAENKNMIVLKELQNNYILIEFSRNL
jgi:hypothetical protein